MAEFAARITPVLTVRDVAAAVEFYQRAFGADVVHRTASATGSVVAELAPIPTGCSGRRWRPARSMSRRSPTRSTACARDGSPIRSVTTG